MESMESLRLVLLFLHFVGLAAMLGGWLAQLSAGSRLVGGGMLHGALLQLVTGVGLVGVLQALHSDDPGEWGEPNNAKYAVKLVLLLAALVLLWRNRRRDPVPPGGWWVIGLLALANLAVAVFWT
jgi:hypothetical protein